jgi:hypothetical protein
MIEHALYYLLRTDPDISALVTDPRAIAFSLLPTGVTLPAVVIHGVSLTPNVALDSTADLFDKRMQFDCYGANYMQSRQVAAAVRNRLIDLRGNLSNGDSPETTVTVQTCILNADFDSPFEQGGAGKGIIYRAIVDVSVWYSDGTIALNEIVGPDAETVKEYIDAHSGWGN